MKKALLTVAAACLLAGPMAFAQANHTPGTPNARHGQHITITQRVEHRVARLTRMLSLTNSQQEQAKTIFTNAANSNSPVMADMRSARKNLQNAMTTNDSNGVKQYAATIGSDTGTLVANESFAFQQFYQTLTPEQQTKLAQMNRRGFMGGSRGKAS